MPIPTPGDLARPPIDLLVWDAPNIDMTLTNIIGRRPTSAVRPRYDAVASWFLADSDGRDAQAVVFTNYTEGTSSNIRPWLEAVRNIGYDVFVRPKLHPEDDIDGDMLSHIAATNTTRRIVRLVVVSGDRRCFEEPLQQLAAAGVHVMVVSFNEIASWARHSEVLHYADLEDIEGAFITPLDRIRLESLPADGAWLRATGSLRVITPEDSAELAEAS